MPRDAYQLDVPAFPATIRERMCRGLEPFFLTCDKQTWFSVVPGAWKKVGGELWGKCSHVSCLAFPGTDPDGLLRANYTSVLTNLGAALHGFHDVMKGEP